VQPPEQRPRERHPETHPDERVDGADAQRPNSLSTHPFVRERTGKRRRISVGVWRPHSEKQCNRYLVEPTRSEAQGGGRWRIDPLRVIKRDDGRRNGEPAQQGQRRHTDRTTIDANPGIREEECRFKRLALWRRQLRRDLRERRPEQVAENRVSDLRLSLGRPRGENGVPGRLGKINPGRPERCLADPCLALEDESTR